MHRQNLLKSLDRFEKRWLSPGLPYPGSSARQAEERATLAKVRAFAKTHAECFERSLAIGHVTGSAMVVDVRDGRILLTLHKKLGKWLQLGGHCDGQSDVAEVALREAEEESGLTDLLLAGFGEAEATPFDLDAHEIPSNAREGAHIHYDVRFIVVTERPQELAISEESDDLRWFSLAGARAVTDEESMLRQFDKLQYLLDNHLLRPISSS